VSTRQYRLWRVVRGNKPGFLKLHPIFIAGILLSLLAARGGWEQESVRQRAATAIPGPPLKPRREAMARLTLRIDFDAGRAIGPGKVKLLELIDRHGSISAAGRQMGMSYRRAWLLVDSLNHCFRAPLVASQAGGQHGGGASLTEFGHAVVRHYRAVERAAQTAAATDVEALAAALADPAAPPGETAGHKPRRIALSVS
jgi:molybdate transport system regulatory protein